MARLAGDEFTVLLNDMHAEVDVTVVAQKILAAVRRPFELVSGTLYVTTTIGAALSEGDVSDAKTLMAAADSALYAAKEAGRNTYALLSAEGSFVQ